MELFYWRTRAGTEVEFVVYGESGLQAFEVKNHRKVHSTDLRALRAFREDYPEAETAVLHRGSERLRIDGVWCLPVEEFLRQMMPDRRFLVWLMNRTTPMGLPAPSGFRLHPGGPTE